MAVVTVDRFDVCLINLDPTVGSEIKKTRPCVIISPDEINQNLKTVIIAPMTTKARHYPSRVPITFHGKTGQIALDQMRTVDKVRIVKKLGTVHLRTAQKVSDTLTEMFSL